MVDLPAVQVTAAQRDRIYAAFKGRYGLDDEDKVVEAIQGEMVHCLNRTVIDYEGMLIRQEAADELNDRLATLGEGLPEVPDPVPAQEKAARQARAQEQIDQLNAANAEVGKGNP